MKNLYIFLLFSFPLFIRSQEVRYNVILGPSYSWMYANNNKIEGTGSKLGFKVHVQGEYWIGERYGLTGGIGLSLGQGGSLEYEKSGNIWKEVVFTDTLAAYHNLPANSNLTYGMNFLEFIFGLKLRTNQFGKFRFYIHAPEFGINLRTKARGDVEAPGLPGTEDEDIRPMINFFSLFYGFGAGAEISVSNDVTLTAGLRFTQSFTDLTDDNGRFNDGTKEESKGTLSSLDLRLGIIF
jgi:hypothetical protein